ncbi:MAG TPA: exosortase system-associated protein, TIGR04073 family [Verrucomicrobiae bacterium]|nr:exosortase system-associated protein, TIGR04073 family [Verrucomicrobiae bacterium]
MNVRLLGALVAATVFVVSLAHAQTNQPPSGQTSSAQTNQPPQNFKYAATQLREILQAQQAQADRQQPQNAGRKLGRGIANLLFGIVEVPNQITQTTADRGGAAGSTFGVGKGIMRWIARELCGVYEIVTFPIPAPRGYRPILRPEWPGEDYEP